MASSPVTRGAGAAMVMVAAAGSALVAGCAAVGDERQAVAAAAPALPALRMVAPDYAVAGQIAVADLAALKAQGFAAIVNSRPDGEGGAEQPTSAALAAEAARLGLAYVHIPIRPGQADTRAEASRLRDFLAPGRGRTLGFCRSGARAEALRTAALALPR